MSNRRIENVIKVNYDPENQNHQYMMAFCYPKTGAVLVKGNEADVIKYITKKLNQPFHYQVVYYDKKGKSSGQKWKFCCSTPYKIEFKRDTDRLIEITFMDNAGNVRKQVRFDHFPHDYIKELNTIQEQ